MRVRIVAAAAAFVAVSTGAPIPDAFAHHSFAATYIEEKTVTIEGELVQFILRNPHAFVHVNVKEKDVSVVRYVVEWAAGTALGAQGVTRDTLKSGDVIVISGSPARDEADHRLRMLQVKRPKDGWVWGLLPNEKVD